MLPLHYSMASLYIKHAESFSQPLPLTGWIQEDETSSTGSGSPQTPGRLSIKDSMSEPLSLVNCQTASVSKRGSRVLFVESFQSLLPLSQNSSMVGTSLSIHPPIWRLPTNELEYPLTAQISPSCDLYGFCGAERRSCSIATSSSSAPMWTDTERDDLTRHIRYTPK